MNSETVSAESRESVYSFSRLRGSSATSGDLTFHCLYLSSGSSDPWQGAFWGLHCEASVCTLQHGLPFQHTFHVVTGSTSLSSSEQERLHRLWISQWSFPNFCWGTKHHLGGFHLRWSVNLSPWITGRSWKVCSSSATGGHPRVCSPKCLPMFSLSTQSCPKSSHVLGKCWRKHACVFSDLKHKAHWHFLASFA